MRLTVATCELLAGLGVVLQFALPPNWVLALTVSPRLTVAFPRSFVPLLLIALAGLISAVAITSMFWTVTHHH